jgi:hypothetical protein
MGITYSNDNTKLCDKFNEFFVSSIEELEKSIPDTDIAEILNKINTNEQISLLEFKKITKNELNEIEKNLQNNKTICEGMSADIFKTIYESISDQLLDLVNTSLREGIVPSK